MAFTHKLNLNWEGLGRQIVSQNSYSGDSQTSINVAVPDSTSDQLVVFSLDVSQIKSIYIKSDVDMTLETNDGTTPADTLVLVANEPYIWWSGSLFTNLLATDVTALYLTTGSVGAGTFELEVVFDSTP